MKLKKTLIILLVFAMVFSLAACGGEDNGGTGDADTINIGALYNLTGGQASLDQPSYNGFKLAADQINANGGINGKNERKKRYTYFRKDRKYILC